MKKLLEREQYDILHVQMPYSPLFAGRLVSAVPRTTAVVGTFHILPYSSFEKTASRVLARMEKGSLKKLHATMSVSRPTAEFAEIVFGIISQIVPNVIDTSMFKGAARLKKYDAYTNIVFLGRLVERKGVMQLLEAVHLNASKFKRQKVKVLICGRGPLESKARQFVTNKSLSEIVEIKGFVSEKEKPKYLASADIAVFPSLSGESFGIVLLEAIAAGASCVVAGDNPGYNSVLVDMPEVLCDPKDSKKFADLLTKLVSDTKLRARIGLKQKALITAYEVGTVGPEILKVYKSAIAKSKEKTHN
jgi:phosphatidylinositol alpha-mannosyltransferase